MDEIPEEQLKKFLSLYKFPLILTGTGLILLIFGTAVLFKTQNASSEVIFSAAEGSPSGKISGKIHVDVEGAVASPGVYQIQEGSRIISALAAAGGLSASADRGWVAKNMNLAAKVADGGKIYIPALSAEASAGKQNLNGSGNLLGVTAGKVNINTASQTEVEGLPGVGPVTAGKIISGRPYQSAEELKSKKIVGAALYEGIKDLIIVY